jgi:hypothetical protein
VTKIVVSTIRREFHGHNSSVAIPRFVSRLGSRPKMPRALPYPRLSLVLQLSPCAPKALCGPAGPIHRSYGISRYPQRKTIPVV